MAETDPLLKGNDGAQRPARKVRFIQGFRALAIAWIVITHYTYIGDEFWSRFGLRTPLALFTVLSGYLTHQIYSRREDAEGLWEFYWRRLAKLGVMYYSTELLVAVFLGLTLIVNAAGSADVLTAAARFCLDVLGLNVWLTPVALFIPEDEATASEGGRLSRSFATACRRRTAAAGCTLSMGLCGTCKRSSSAGSRIPCSATISKRRKGARAS